MWLIQSKGFALVVNALRRFCRSKLGVQAELVPILCLKKGFLACIIMCYVTQWCILSCLITIDTVLHRRKYD